MSHKPVTAQAPLLAEPPPAERTRSFLLTSISWVLAALALVPLLMAAHGDGSKYLWIGLAMAVAAVCLHGLRRLLAAVGR